jgi:hypothetical protein
VQLAPSILLLGFVCRALLESFATIVNPKAELRLSSGPAFLTESGSSAILKAFTQGKTNS